jgi:uncharacterized protein (TIGR02147 family)
MKLVNVFEYFNYRDYLKDYYQLRKENDPYFSYRAFANRAGYNSSGLYSLIVSGVRNLTPRYAPGFTKALGLDDKEAEYFQLMLQYTHAVSEKVRKELFIKMVQMLPQQERKLKLCHREFYSEWYFVAIHQALSILNINENNPEELTKFLNPYVGLREIKKAIKVLLELELIKKDESGFWKPISGNISGGVEVGKVYINDFQKNMLDLAKKSYENFSKEKRYTITESFAVSDSVAQLIHEKAQNFHNEIISLILSDKKPEEKLLQLNLQLFPLQNEEKK